MSTYEFPYFYKYTISFPETIDKGGREAIPINSPNPIGIGHVITFHNDPMLYTVVDIKHDYWAISGNQDEPTKLHRTVLVLEELVDYADVESGIW